MKKILCICFTLAFVITMISCHKECVCKKDVSYLETTDTTTVDTTSAAKPNIDSIMYHAGRIYDKKECEYLNVSDTNLSNGAVTTLTCNYEKMEK